MKKTVLLAGAALVAGLTVGAESGTINAAWFEATISPEIGARIAGYSTDDVSEAKQDDLKASGLCLDDGERRILLVSMDLIGMDYETIVAMRKRLAGIVKTEPDAVMISTTHTHEGPHTPMYAERNGLVLGGERAFDETAGSADMAYMEKLHAALAEAAKGMMAGGFKPCRLGYYSDTCDENRNRRYTTSDNHATFNAHRPFLHRITDTIADKEVGTVALLGERNRPAYVLCNYSAHPLTGHAPGLGGLRISPDYPGFYRRYVESETGAKAMFLQGAAGDTVTKDDELGSAAARRVGENLAMKSILGVLSIQRCHARYVFDAPKVGWETRKFKSRLREKYRKALGKETGEFEVQVLAVGDICFVGLPGEIVNEIGLEVKWNSPFARTYMAFLATGYIGYVTPANLMAAGGYEPHSMRFQSRDTLTMVKTAQDAMYALRERMHPEDYKGADPYPDDREYPVVNVPGMYKGTKWEK